MSSTKIGMALFIILIILLVFAITISTFTGTFEAVPGGGSDGHPSDFLLLNIPREVLGGALLGTVLVISALIYTVIKKQNKSKKENEQLIRGKQQEITKIEKILQTLRREYKNTRCTIGTTTLADIEKAREDGDMTSEEAEISIKRYNILEEKKTSLADAIASMETEVNKLKLEITELR